MEEYDLKKYFKICLIIISLLSITGCKNEECTDGKCIVSFQKQIKHTSNII